MNTAPIPGLLWFALIILDTVVWIMKFVFFIPMEIKRVIKDESAPARWVSILSASLGFIGVAVTISAWFFGWYWPCYGIALVFYLLGFYMVVERDRLSSD